MLPSMYSGISGLKANQKKLDVVGNNIANSSTTAFKSQSIKFQDSLSQNMREATGPSTNLGGTNPRQVGSGVQIAGIDTDTGTGSLQPTNRPLDFMIDGEGYFMVAKGQTVFGDPITVDQTTHLVTDAKDMEIKYTRDGSFSRDNDGNLITSDGYRVLGYNFGNITEDTTTTDAATKKGAISFVDANATTPTPDGLKTLVIPDYITTDTGNKAIQRITVDKGVVKAILSDGSVSLLGQIAMASFQNPGGLSKIGRNMYENTANSGLAVIGSSADVATADPTNDNSKAFGDINQGCLEMSNVDLAQQFTDMIIASRAFQANGKIISTGDEILQDLVGLKR